jgi:hypothetical protein
MKACEDLYSTEVWQRMKMFICSCHIFKGGRNILDVSKKMKINTPHLSVTL